MNEEPERTENRSQDGPVKRRRIDLHDIPHNYLSGSTNELHARAPRLAENFLSQNSQDFDNVVSYADLQLQQISSYSDPANNKEGPEDSLSLALRQATDDPTRIQISSETSNLGSLNVHGEVDCTSWTSSQLINNESGQSLLNELLICKH